MMMQLAALMSSPVGARSSSSSAGPTAAMRAVGDRDRAVRDRLAAFLHRQHRAAEHDRVPVRGVGHGLLLGATPREAEIVAEAGRSGTGTLRLAALEPDLSEEPARAPSRMGAGSLRAGSAGAEAESGRGVATPPALLQAAQVPALLLLRSAGAGQPPRGRGQPLQAPQLDLLGGRRRRMVEVELAGDRLGHVTVGDADHLDDPPAAARQGDPDPVAGANQPVRLAAVAVDLDPAEARTRAEPGTVTRTGRPRRARRRGGPPVRQP